jgi:hypothetical protein
VIERKKVVTSLAPAEVIGSLCACGHVGDASEPLTQHEGMTGHGRCKIRGCMCKQFTWAAFLEVER